MPGDKNKDNIYEVTVVASDGEMTAMRSLTVKVVDTDEDGHGGAVVAGRPDRGRADGHPQDSDGGVPDPATFIDREWQWYSLAATETALDAD